MLGADAERLLRQKRQTLKADAERLLRQGLQMLEAGLKRWPSKEQQIKAQMTE